MPRIQDVAALLFVGMHLAMTPVARADVDVAEGAWYDPSPPIPVMHIEGSIEDVARAHGALLAKHPKAKETLEYLSHVVDHKLTNSPRLAGHPVFQALLGWAYRHFIRNPLIEHVPDRYRAAYAAFAKAAGLDEDLVWDALVLPDAGLRSVSLLYKTELAPLLPSGFGCTSVIWNSGHDSVLHARNLDYEGVGYWDRNQVIMHVIPNEGLAYVAVTAFGVHAPGITAFNESGLTLAIHQLTFNDTQSSGTPLPVISAEVIRNARTIDDAIAIIKGFPRAGGWAYVLSQGRDRAVVESSANEIAIRRSSEPFFYQTNHVSSPALASRQIFYSPGSWLDSFERADALANVVSRGGAKGWATPERIASLISGNADESRRRVAGGTINKLDNIQSVIMDAAHRRIWVARGTPSRAPNEGTFIEYRWTDLRSADAPEVTGAEVTIHAEGKMAESKMRELLRAATNQNDLESRDRLLEEYAKKVEELTKDGVPPAGAWAGLYLGVWSGLRDGKDAGHLLKRIDLALKDEDLIEARGASTVEREAVRHRVAAGRLTRGHLLDLLGRRSEALYEYAVVRKTTEFARVRKSAEKNLRKAFNWEQARATSIDWAGIDLFSY